MLHAETTGRGRRLVLVHGFTQNGRCWAPVPGLDADHELVVVDAPGHGRSSGVAADAEEAGRLLGEAGGQATYVGYSLGGRLSLHLALARPDLVKGLVLIGATAGIEDGEERAARVAADEALAARLEQVGVDAFLDEWLALPLFAGLSPAAASIEARRENTVAGMASSLRLAGTGAQASRWAELRELTMPVLVLAGADDHRFAALAPRLAAAIGANAEVALVPEAGHAAHLQQPKAFLDIVRPWLARHGL